MMVYQQTPNNIPHIFDKMTKVNLQPGQQSQGCSRAAVLKAQSVVSVAMDYDQMQHIDNQRLGYILNNICITSYTSDNTTF